MLWKWGGLHTYGGEEYISGCDNGHLFPPKLPHNRTDGDNTGIVGRDGTEEIGEATPV